MKALKHKALMLKHNTHVRDTFSKTKLIAEVLSRSSSSNSNGNNTVSSDESLEVRRRAQSETKISDIQSPSFEYTNEKISFKKKKLEISKVKDNFFKSKNFLLKSDVCALPSSFPHSSSKELDPIFQYYYPGVDSTKGKQSTSLKYLHYKKCQSQICKHIQKNKLVTSSSLEDVETSAYDEESRCSSNMKNRLSSSSTSTFSGMNPYYVFQNNSEINTRRSSYSGNVISNGSNLYSSNSQISPDININSNSSLNNQIPLMNPTISRCPQILYGNYSDETLGELAVYLVKEQNGCRFIQDKVRNDPYFANNHLFPNLLKEISDIICDSFGNYLFQILFDVLSIQNLSIVISKIKNDIDKICFSSYGTRVIQKLIETIQHNDDLLNQFNQLLTNNLIVSIAQNVHGNHIIKKYISDIPYPKNQVIFNAVQNNFIAISNTKHGCCIIQKCLKEANSIQKEALIDQIYKHLFLIISDQYGNYIFQYLVSYESEAIQLETIKLILPKLISMCKHKYSSNALEKFFENSNETLQAMILNQILEKDTSIDDLLLDPFGNYIIQKALVIAKGANYKKLLYGIARNINKLKGVNFGVKLIAKLISNHQELGQIISNEQKNINERGNYKGMNQDIKASFAKKKEQNGRYLK